MKLAEFLCGQSDSTYLTLKPQPLPHLLSSDFTGQKQADRACLEKWRWLHDTRILFYKNR